MAETLNDLLSLVDSMDTDADTIQTAQDDVVTNGLSAPEVAQLTDKLSTVAGKLATIATNAQAHAAGMPTQGVTTDTSGETTIPGGV